MKNPFKKTPKGRTVLPPKIPPPPTDHERLREVLRILNNLNCEYEIIYENKIKYTKKSSA